MCQRWLHPQQSHFKVFFKPPPCFRQLAHIHFGALLNQPPACVPPQGLTLFSETWQHWGGDFTWSLGCDKWPSTAWGARQTPPAQWWWQLASFLHPVGMCRGGSWMQSQQPQLGSWVPKPQSLPPSEASHMQNALLSGSPLKWSGFNYSRTEVKMKK